MNLLLKRIKELEAENKSLTARIDELNQEIQRADNREAEIKNMDREDAVDLLRCLIVVNQQSKSIERHELIEALNYAISCIETVSELQSRVSQLEYLCKETGKIVGFKDGRYITVDEFYKSDKEIELEKEVAGLQETVSKLPSEEEFRTRAFLLMYKAINNRITGGE